MKDNFLLSNSLAEELYSEVAKLPVVDFHNHLSIADLATDRKFSDLSELWLVNDPYKHRALRILGVEERMITGDVPNYKKFEVWAEHLPRLIGNPLYHWSQMELFRIFGIDEPLSKRNFAEVWLKTQEKLNDDNYTALKLLERFNVEVACPCAMLTDDLQMFQDVIRKTKCRIIPSLRADNVLDCEAGFFNELASLSGIEIVSLKTLREAISCRLKLFNQLGCRFADHSLDAGFVYLSDDGKNEKRFGLLLQGKSLEHSDRMALQSELLRILGEEYAGLNWTVQLHIGAQRQTSSRLRRIAGPAGGYACVGQACRVKVLTLLLDDWERSNAGMPDVILFTLNPADNAVMATLTGSFAEDGKPGKVQFGPAWWLNDHILGMKDHFETLAAYGVISTFIGMTTDSRSLMSFVRHEYYRRVLCNWIAENVSCDEMPNDFDLLRETVIALCYRNASRYFLN